MTDLTETLRLHAMWLINERGGRRADLCGATLRYTDLRGADLREANLYEANLCGANLRYANLSEADLRYADLRYANLRYADLYEADLRYADLRYADLYEANLCYADLYEANLCGADLRGAGLREANLCEANLSCSKGLAWAAIGPVGQGRRTLTGVWINDGIRVFGGCFVGSIETFRAVVTAEQPPWDWGKGSAEDIAQWRGECLAAANHIETSITGRRGSTTW